MEGPRVRNAGQGGQSRATLIAPAAAERARIAGSGGRRASPLLLGGASYAGAAGAPGRWLRGGVRQLPVLGAVLGARPGDGAGAAARAHFGRLFRAVPGTCYFSLTRYDN